MQSDSTMAVNLRAVRSKLLTGRRKLIFILFGFAALLMMLHLMGLFYNQDVLAVWNTIEVNQIRFVQDEEADKGNLVDTPGCAIDRILPFDKRYPETMGYFTATKPLECNTGSNALTSFEDGVLVFDQTVRENSYQNIVKCTSRSFTINPNDKNDVAWGEEEDVSFTSFNHIKHEFFQVQCISSKGEVLYKIKYKQIIKKNRPDGRPFPERGPGDSDKMNVLILGVDSVSRNSLLRNAPDLNDYITQHLGGVNLEGFNKVGDNTGVNVYAMVRGRQLYPDFPKLIAYPWDSMDWVWDPYKKDGYVSLLAEEVSRVRHISFVKEFDNSVALHNRRADRLVASMIDPVPQHTDPRKASNCYGPKHKVENLLKWIAQFAYVYKSNKNMALIWMSDATHDSLNEMGSIKQYFIDFFKNGKEDGTLNNTFIIFTSDHGIRIGDYYATPAGAYEARLPFIYLIPPAWFQQKHKVAYDNLKTNSKRLTTFYDIHKTLQAILQTEFTQDIHTNNQDHPGKSLFTEIPESRTCDTAGIPAHFCSCGAYTDVPVEDPRAIKAGQMLVNSLNNIIQTNNFETKCVIYKDFTVEQAKLKYVNGASTQHQEIYITIKTKPVLADFRSTIRLQENNPLIFHIERLNQYKDFMSCIAFNNYQQILHKVCICKSDVKML